MFLDQGKESCRKLVAVRRTEQQLHTLHLVSERPERHHIPAALACLWDDDCGNSDDMGSHTRSTISSSDAAELASSSPLQGSVADFAPLMWAGSNPGQARQRPRTLQLEFNFNPALHPSISDPTPAVPQAAFDQNPLQEGQAPLLDPRRWGLHSPSPSMQSGLTPLMSSGHPAQQFEGHADTLGGFPQIAPRDLAEASLDDLAAHESLLSRQLPEAAGGRLPAHAHQSLAGRGRDPGQLTFHPGQQASWLQADDFPSLPSWGQSHRASLRTPFQEPNLQQASRGAQDDLEVASRAFKLAARESLSGLTDSARPANLPDSPHAASPTTSPKPARPAHRFSGPQAIRTSAISARHPTQATAAGSFPRLKMSRERRPPVISFRTSRRTRNSQRRETEAVAAAASAPASASTSPTAALGPPTFRSQPPMHMPASQGVVPIHPASATRELQATQMVSAGDPWQGLELPDQTPFGGLLPQARGATDQEALEQDYLRMFGFPDDGC
ncbi:hypothetical protein WJX73_001586 [Symbiochloris irregularis]|uniref:Uncharacterized protein n=1 Tax=Symbiochloris irregularis TaxID=706552 RepID=A0AAW1P456_9CHLO